MATQMLGVAELVPVRTRTLFPPVVVETDLYIQQSFRTQPRLWSTADQPPSGEDLSKLLKRGCVIVYMRADAVSAFRAQLRELANSGTCLPAELRIEIAREAIKDDFARAWRANKVDPLVEYALEFSQKVVDICCGNEEMIGVLAALAAHDGDTFTHISNVCTYAIMLARSMSISSEVELAAIGQATLLHDVGKRFICTDILQKPGPLTPAERQAMQDHPRLGFLELCNRPELTREQLLIVYQHHEKLDGTGYPVGIAGDEIARLSQLCAVVDVFDAVTARRCYREKCSPDVALEILNEGIGNHFASEYVQCWNDMVKSAAAMGSMTSESR